MSVDTPTLNVLTLCSGAGGLDLGVKLAIPTARVVCAVEIEAFACEVLAARMEEGWLDSAPIWTDLRTFDGRPWRGVVDCIIGAVRGILCHRCNIRLSAVEDEGFIHAAQAYLAAPVTTGRDAGAVMG